MGKRLIPYTALKERGIPYSRAHIQRLEKQGLFPQRVYLNTADGGKGTGAFAYPEDEIDSYIDGLLAARDAERGGK